MIYTSTMKIIRYCQDFNAYLKPNKALVIYGPRQSGKTTLIKDFIKNTKLKYRFDLGDDITVQKILNSESIETLKNYTAGYDLIIIDEAQLISGIGKGLKLIIDAIPNIKIIATGSSSFELAGQIGEPLVGRKQTLILYPLSNYELLKHFNKYDLKEKLPELLVYGSYPAVFTADTASEKIKLLQEITNSNLYKDILALDKIKNAKIIADLVRLLAYQIGQEVSHHELASQLAVDAKTVARYLDLLEKSFVLFNLRGLARNLRKEISKKSKYYFYDLGVRNAAINNFNALELRNDQGQLWENFCAMERLKKQAYAPLYANNFFWRTWDQKEIDWVEEREGKYFAYEFKWKKNKAKLPKDFLQAYPGSEYNIISQDNYLDFIL